MDLRSAMFIFSANATYFSLWDKSTNGSKRFIILDMYQFGEIFHIYSSINSKIWGNVHNDKADLKEIPGAKIKTSIILHRH